MSISNRTTHAIMVKTGITQPGNHIQKGEKKGLIAILFSIVWVFFLLINAVCITQVCTETSRGANMFFDIQS